MVYFIKWLYLQLIDHKMRKQGKKSTVLLPFFESLLLLMELNF